MLDDIIEIVVDLSYEEFEEMYAEGEGTSYYTNWYEESITYKNN